jgi:hypothetical protein
MSGLHFKIFAYFCATFAWMYMANIAAIWLVCRFAKTKRDLHLLGICHGIAVLAGLCSGFIVFSAINTDDSIPKDQRTLLGLAILFFSYSLPAVGSMLTVKFFFPKKWEQYWQIKNSLR